MLECEEAPGTTHAGLDLIADEQGPRVTAARLRAEQVVIRWEIHALALHRLHDERRDVATGELALERIEVAESHGVAAGQQRTEAVPEPHIPVQRERNKRQP